MTYPVDHTHDPNLRSWVSSAEGHPEFPIQNLPYGLFCPEGAEVRPGCAIGDKILDLRWALPWLPSGLEDALSSSTLNALLALPADAQLGLRRAISAALSDPTMQTRVQDGLFDAGACTLHVPASIGDYTDFYAGIHHARNAGALFRPDAPLFANYKWIPIAYHSRASSVRASGHEVVRPHGQRLDGREGPRFGASRALDFELEVGVWIGAGNALGAPIPVSEARDHVAGLCLLNDWSARDLQAWEYQPLGPFLAKSFQTSISPWVVTTAALAPFRVAQPPRPDGDPRPMAYLADAQDEAEGAFAVEVEAHLTTVAMRAAGLQAARIARAPMTSLYWTAAQMVAHQTSNGCNLRPGDLLGTGTISAEAPDGRGCLLEITEAGRKPLTLPNGESRTYLEDGDEVIFRAHAKAPGRVTIGFGECRGRILPAVS